MIKDMSRVLVVEDDPDIREVMRLSLETLGGFEVLTCASGSAAIEQAPFFAPDLILLDAMMPAMDGQATLAALREFPPLADTAVVFVTAKAMPDEVARMKELGAVDVIAKPFDPMTLADSLRRIWNALHG